MNMYVLSINKKQSGDQLNLGEVFNSSANDYNISVQ